MSHILVECPPSNSGALLLVGTTVIGSGGVDVSFWAGEDFNMLVLSVINAVKTWRLSVSSVSISLVSLWFLSASCLLDSMVASMPRNCSSELVSILLPPFGILKLEV